jgi:hypothetical protein
MTNVEFPNISISDSMGIVYALRELNVNFQFRILRNGHTTSWGALFSFVNSADATMLLLKYGDLDYKVIENLDEHLLLNKQ